MNDLEKIIKEGICEIHEKELNNIPSNKELKKEYYPLSDLFYKKNNKTIKKYKRKKTIFTYSKNVAAIITIAIILSVISNPGTITKAENIFVQWLEKSIDFNFKIKDNDLREYEICYVPNGFELIFYDFQVSAGTIKYKNKDDFINLYYTKNGNAVSIDNKNAKLEIILDNNNKLYYMVSTTESNNSLTWEQDGITFVITSTLNKDEMIKVYKSIKEKSSY